jgi:GNAT superfamily N-acetyltransferase
MVGGGASIMIDSNVFIAAEDHGDDGHPYGATATSLLSLAARLGHRVCVSHGTRSDLLRAPAEVGDRRRRQLTKYHVLERVPDNRIIRAAFPTHLSPNDSADLEVLSSFATGVTTWLVSEDRRLRRRARSVGIERVYDLDQAVELLQALSTPTPARLPAAERVPAYTIDLDAPVFDGLKSDYAGEFEAWWRGKVVPEDRPAIVLGRAGAPQGIAVLKAESPAPHGWDGPTLKMCTFKVAEGYQGGKRGELLLKAVLDLARADGHASLYVEVLPDKEDLVSWLEQFGFAVVPGLTASRDQLVLRKALRPTTSDDPLDPLEHAVRYGPGSVLIDAAHAVPIRDGWHHRLLPEADPQDDLFAGQEACGNAIRKGVPLSGRYPLDSAR